MRSDIELVTRDGVTLRGWHFVPDGAGPFPTVVMAHGFSAVKEMALEPFARSFAAAGLASLVFDHRGFGASAGEPRQEIDPWLQVRDYSDAVTFAEGLSETDPGRIGAWGTSYSAGHVIVLAGQDRRVRCIVGQVPIISGSENARRLVPAPALAGAAKAYREDRRARMRGEPPAFMPVVSDDPTVPAVLATPDSWAWSMEVALDTTWENRVTLRTVELAFGYEPGLHIGQVSPTPLLLVVALDDLVCPADLAIEAYSRAHEPKRLVTLPGGHFDPYSGPCFERASSAASDWFVEHLS